MICECPQGRFGAMIYTNLHIHQGQDQLRILICHKKNIQRLFKMNIIKKISLSLCFSPSFKIKLHKIISCKKKKICNVNLPGNIFVYLFQASLHITFKEDCVFKIGQETKQTQYKKSTTTVINIEEYIINIHKYLYKYIYRYIYLYLYSSMFCY